MADINRLMGAPSDQFNVATQTNAIATATLAAVAGFQWFLTGFSISASAAPAAAVSATLKDGVGGTIIDQFEIPATAFAPVIVNFTRPIGLTAGNAGELSLPALGAAVKATVSLRGFKARQA